MSETSTLIRRLRAAGYSQTEISRQTGIPQPRLSRWENDEAPTSADDVLRLAAFAEKVLPLGKPDGPEPSPALASTAPAEKAA